jgi:hemoglobin
MKTTLLANTIRFSARRALAHAVLVCAALHGTTAVAQSAPADTLYGQLGGQTGLVTLVDDFMVRLLNDARMKPFFKDVDQKHLKAQLVAQFCQVSGGPCKLDGPDMKRAHAEMDITKSNFNALVEVLQQSMDARGIAFGTQNRLLAQLAPMHRDIINTP